MKISYSRVYYIVLHICKWVFYIGAGTLAAMMFMTFISAATRYLFNAPILGVDEITEYMMALIISLGLGYTAMLKGHVAVDLIVRHLGRQTRLIISIVSGLIVIVIVSLIVWQGFKDITVIYGRNLESPVLGIPVFPFTAVVALGLFTFLIALLLDFVNTVYKDVTLSEDVTKE